MEFCPSCGSILVPKDGKFSCACGHEQGTGGSTMHEEHERPQETAGAVAHTTHPLASFDHVCSKCGYGKAQLVTKGVFVTDEDESIEYLCGRCGHHDPEEGLKMT